ncbi:family 16 glycosylhydrolase [Fulvivirga maritima]|uniref:family 16 glycosylhydrolase n=1 Tax=Fulvivirga maritima TaxID=2904247 RepID=UPI001F1C824F|nr:family 16 glycosylhydrolase [Fulvivirga maritima]UII24824.1 family 16 glycosylhydrolase [Fulvivirga maritima]
MKKNFLITCLCLLFVGACGEDNDDPEAMAPSGLELNYTLSGDDNVTFTATAENANYFTFQFGDAENEPVTRANNGIVSHTYTASGEYVVTARAHASSSVYSETSVTVEITLPRDDDDDDDSDDDFQIPTTGYTTPESYDGMVLVWSDEFDGDELNTADWTYEIGNGVDGWGNQELEYYQEDNTTVQDGMLIIEAREEAQGGYNYTSSRIITKDKQSFRYGRVDIRAALPQGQGIWPALWMLGSNIDDVSWPRCGEIDIMEMVGGSVENRDATVHSTLHWYAQSQDIKADYGGSTTLSSGIFADEFHVFSMVWDAQSMVFFVDDQQFFVIDIQPEDLNEFHENFFFIFNVAVGGLWPGSPDATTVFPQRMVVDYVRVFQPED